MPGSPIELTTKGQMHQIELIGSYTAASKIGGEEFSITTKRADPVPHLSRALVSRGADPQAAVKITRDGKPIWQKDRTLGAWAGMDITEEDRDGLRIRPHRPLLSEAVGPKYWSK